ncbi:dethiobiotin synthase [Candidatus Pseudothioglobus singularis]|nr:dethiobiotin synthase [Candidatus Pseudothioglobus singularis]
MNGVFVTGSNTEVGKTTVSVEIIKQLRKKRKVVVRKPVETDCELVDGSYFPKDAVKLNEACASGESLSQVCPYCFELEASPEEASLDAGQSLGLEDLVYACNDGVGESFVFVEGAGGFYSPIADNALNSDLAAQLELPVIIIVKDELGAISQALLTIDAVLSKKLKIAFVVLNELRENTLSNLEALRSYTDVPVLKFSIKNSELFYLEVEKLI